MTILFVFSYKTNRVFYLIINHCIVIETIILSTYKLIKFFVIETIENIIYLMEVIDIIKFYLKKPSLSFNISFSEGTFDKLIEVLVFIYNLDDSYIFLKSLRPLLLFILWVIKKLRLLNNYFVYFLKINF